MKTQYIHAILIIDDEQLLSDILKLRLTKEGFTVRTAAHGRQALRILEDFQPQLVITDIFMAEMDGFEVISAVKQRLPKAKIMAMSGEVTDDTMNFLPVAKKLGADRTLAKPIEFADLLDLIGELDQEEAKGTV